MKNIFTEAEVEVKAFELEDVITTSTPTEATCEDQMPDMEI